MKNSNLFLKNKMKTITLIYQIFNQKFNHHNISLNKSLKEKNKYNNNNKIIVIYFQNYLIHYNKFTI